MLEPQWRQWMRNKVLLFAVLLVASVQFSSPVSLDDDLKIELKDRRVRDFSLEGLTLVFYVNITNSSSKTYYLSSYDYRFLVNHQDYIQLQKRLDEGLKIEAKNEILVAFPVKITYEHLFRAIPEMREETHPVCNLVGWAWFSDGRRERGKLALTFTGEFPIFWKPEVELENIHVKTLTIGGADIDFEVKFLNRNKFDLLVDRISYNLILGGHPLDQGMISGDKNIEKQGEKIFALPFLLDFFDVGKDVYSILRQSSSQCTFSGEVEIQTVWGRLTIPYEKRGAVSITRTP
jgi:LEA14-like dessication related protein